MKNKTMIGIGLIGIISLCGCASHMVPKTVISGTINNVPFKIESPKDSKLTGLDIVVQKDGSATIRIESLEASMNPDVVTMSGKL